MDRVMPSWLGASPPYLNRLCKNYMNSSPTPSLQQEKGRIELGFNEVPEVPLFKERDLG